MIPSAISRPRVGAAVTTLVLLGVAWLAWTWWSAERALDQRDVERLGDHGVGAAAASLDGVLDVLVVGNDDRADLSEEERRRLHTGSFEGERTDTILWVQLRDDGVSLVSFPRDLRVEGPDGTTTRINQVLERGGPDALVGTVEDLLEVDLDHYVEVSISSFLEIVEAAGGVEICLDAPLRDAKSGADFVAGCHVMDGADALSYVRSRQGDRADFARVERQQRFLSALADRATSLPVLANPVRLRSVATTVADGLTVDDQLSVPRMLDIAASLRQVLAEGVDAFTLPAYPDEAGGVAYVVPYGPGVAALGERLRTGQPLPERPSEDDRSDVEVAIRATGASAEASRVESVLYFAGYLPSVGGPADGVTDPRRTTVYASDDARSDAEAIAAVLGAPVEVLPAGAPAAANGRILVVTV